MRPCGIFIKPAHKDLPQRHPFENQQVNGDHRQRNKKASNVFAPYSHKAQGNHKRCRDKHSGNRNKQSVSRTDLSDNRSRHDHNQGCAETHQNRPDVGDPGNRSKEIGVPRRCDIYRYTCCHNKAHKNEESSPQKKRRDFAVPQNGNEVPQGVAESDNDPRGHEAGFKSPVDSEVRHLKGNPQPEKEQCDRGDNGSVISKNPHVRFDAIPHLLPLCRARYSFHGSTLQILAHSRHFG